MVTNTDADDESTVPGNPAALPRHDSAQPSGTAVRPRPHREAMRSPPANRDETRRLSPTPLVAAEPATMGKERVTEDMTANTMTGTADKTETETVTDVLVTTPDSDRRDAEAGKPSAADGESPGGEATETAPVSSDSASSSSFEGTTCGGGVPDHYR